MTLNQIDTYLSASREYIDNSKRKIARMGFCCPSMFLGSLIDRQNYLERQVWNERHRDTSMGILWFGVGIVSAAAIYLGAYVYDHYTQAKTQSRYLNCLEKYQTEFSMSPEEAETVCRGGDSVKEDITSTIKLGIYGSIAIMAMYVVSKFIGKKR